MILAKFKCNKKCERNKVHICVDSCISFAIYIIHRFRLGSLTFLRRQAVPSNATSGGVPRLVDTVRVPTSTSLCYRHRQSPVGEITFY